MHKKDSDTWNVPETDLHPNGRMNHDQQHSAAVHNSNGHGEKGTTVHDEIHESTVDSGSSLSHTCHSLKQNWNILAIGQLLTLLLASGGAAQSELYLECSLSAPTFTMCLSYFFLAVIHLTILFGRHRKTREQQQQYVQDTHRVLVVHRNSYSFLFGCLELQRPVWQYMVMGFLDLQANAITMLSFRYTTLTSVTLFDSLAIPSAMFLSKCFLNRQYKTLHLLGVITCMVGVVINVFQDYESNLDETKTDGSSATTSTTDEEYPHKLWGDVFAIIGGVMYGLNDVVAEAMVRGNGDTSEYLGVMGFFAFFISLVQSLSFERDEIAMYWHGGTADGEIDGATCSMAKGWVLLTVFVAVTVLGYMGGLYFLTISEATFFNLSLLTGDLWSVIFSVVAQKIVPPLPFFIALFFVIGGIVVYEMAPHPVVQDMEHEAWVNTQLADIDREFELEQVSYQRDHPQEDTMQGPNVIDYDDYDENGMELS